MRHFGLVVSLLAALIFHPVQASAPIEPQMPSGLCTTYRHQYGAESAQQAAQLLGYPCYHNWIADSYGVPGHTPFAYSLYPSYLAGYVAEAKDGEFWLLGNEPNIGSTFTKSSAAAEFTRGWVAQTDTAWACCGTLQHYEHGYLLAWLDGYLAAGGAIPDVWHIHIYFVDNAGWDATLAQFRAWMTANDVVRPVIISETAQTNGDAEPLLRHVAKAVCDGRVQAVYWYIGDRDFHSFAPSSQLTIDGAITNLGKTFVESRVCPAGESGEFLMWLPATYP